jgi:hypothetical protein
MNGIKLNYIISNLYLILLNYYNCSIKLILDAHLFVFCYVHSLLFLYETILIIYQFILN